MSEFNILPLMLKLLMSFFFRKTYVVCTVVMYVTFYYPFISFLSWYMRVFIFYFCITKSKEGENNISISSVPIHPCGQTHMSTHPHTHTHTHTHMPTHTASVPLETNLWPDVRTYIRADIQTYKRFLQLLH